ncbi:flagellar basal body L-ring protein FlgH [Colwellia psychrerythraea]|uniref:Flagellar L-ring protein n=1 Tax=Colwellia psychrerythraea (strain 34H / ATCC BAA-681) TaxID=167879 RepID=FLGH_COLP3|nr:flagellar basal body L-ring protein FlgH [Colwellia psychrerythraea]Q485P0.1 RecName: Full=Flagellar L-ring protein; AltName: Full=Basal body L-ring protein; Flags: Precursor [Colwellia psychrerythraea 34H]AAZ24076.1 flagellar L-ring protein FlgH [Colwellia psychrerythraea 34H]
MKNKNRLNTIKLLSISLLIAVTTACSNTVELSKALPNDPDFAPIMPEEEEERIVPSGSLFKPHYVNNIYSDSKAHRVGDIISVILSEKTQAKKNAKTELKKANETNLDAVTGLGGVPVSINGESLQFGISQDSNFKGDAKADQGNSLSGNISVHVLRVLPNGNLMIRGEKWLTLNNGDEYIRLTGVIRSKDINSNNTILSNKVANARIQYAGTGSFADSNEQGWLVKFFNSTWWPF